MIHVRKSKERGYFQHGWLETFHSFSFADYYDPQFMGYGPLRVINEDKIAAGQGFGTHGHKNMEIITYLISGQLEHKDSMGNGSIINPGDIQYMSAGSGVMHSEFNPNAGESSHLLQIWIQPNVPQAQPRYGQKHFSEASKLNQLCLLVSESGEGDSIAIRQKARVYGSILQEGRELKLNGHALSIPDPAQKKLFWLQLIRGELLVNQVLLEAGDAAYGVLENDLLIKNKKAAAAEFLLFEMG